MGGMEYAISPVNPGILYLVLEAADKKGGHSDRPTAVLRGKR